MPYWTFASRATEAAARRLVAGEQPLSFDDVRCVKPSVPLPRPSDYGDEAASQAFKIRAQNAETAPPTFVDYPVGTLAVDRDGDVFELRVFRIGDPKLQEKETPGRFAVEKYVEWIKAGHLPPPIRVMESEKGNYVVSDGHHRLAALRFAKRKTVKAWVAMTINRELPNAAIPGTVFPEGLTLERAQAAFR